VFTSQYELDLQIKWIMFCSYTVKGRSLGYEMTWPVPKGKCAVTSSTFFTLDL